jgi:hypothetical protein
MKKEHHSMIRRYDHVFLLWNIFAQSLITESLDQNSCFLIEIELRRLHRRFDHLSTRRLQAILDRSDHEINFQAIEYFIKFCHHCQIHGKSSSRFSFTLKDDLEFNFNVIVDILYLKIKSDVNKSILHVVNETIRFQVDRWLKDITARHVWNQLRICWIDTYLDSLDLIISDADKQFIAREFKQYAFNMSIRVNIVSIETHHSIDMIERYHDSLRRVYAIIIAKISDIDSNSILQMTFKALNDSTEFNDLISTLLVFEAYLRMIEMNALSSTITQRFIAMRKTMNEVRKSIAARQVNDALNIRNGSSSTLIHNLSLNSDVLVHREKNDNQSVGSPLLRGWYGFQSTNSEHALNTIVVGWKWYDFLKLVGDGRSTIRWFRIQRFSDVISTWSRFMLSSMNRHWHFFKMIVDRFSL